MLKVSVVIPIYNVEKYIERCVRSLMEQTLDDIEYIFVNDASLDNSLEILKSVVAQFPNRMSNVHIINHNCNQGLACARKTGIDLASGEYLIHCDSDDWVELDIYEKLYDAAKRSDADIVVCNYKTIAFSGCFNCTVDKIYDLCSIPSGYRWSIWNKLVRRSLIVKNDIYPIPHIDMCEDENTALRLYYHANKITYIDDVLYNYDRTRETSITAKMFSEKYLHQRQESLRFIRDYFAQRKYQPMVDWVDKEIVRVKDPSLFITKGIKLGIWRDFLPEANGIVQNSDNFKTIYKLVYNIASHGFYLPLKLYYKFS